MNDLLLWAGRIAGIVGVLIFVVTVVARMSGRFFFLEFQTGTLFQAGIALMLVGCLGYLALITRLMREPHASPKLH